MKTAWLASPPVSREEREVRQDVLPQYMRKRLPNSCKEPKGRRNKARFKEAEDWEHHKLPTAVTLVVAPVKNEDENKYIALGTRNDKSTMDTFTSQFAKAIAPFLIAM